MRNDPSMNSYNHYAYGAVADWIYRYAAGIDTSPKVIVALRSGLSAIVVLPLSSFAFSIPSLFPSKSLNGLTL